MRVYKASNSRSEQRSNVILNATLYDGSVSNKVRVRNLSSHGALLEGSGLPTTGTRVRLVRGRYAAAGQIVWHRSLKCGVRFEQEVDVFAWRLAESQQLVEPSIESLPVLSAALDQICENLATTPGLLIQCGDELAKLDALASSLRRLAGRRVR